MNYIDYHDLAMFNEKWKGVWFFIQDFKPYTCGELKSVVHLSRNNTAIVLAKFYYKTKSVEVPIAVFGGNGSSAAPTKFLILKPEDYELYKQAVVAGKYIRYIDLCIQVFTTANDITELPFSVPISLDFSFPEPGFVYIRTGSYKGFTFEIRRAVIDTQLRGCNPYENLQLFSSDWDIFNREAMLAPKELVGRSKLLFYVSLYDALVHTKPITLLQGVRQLKLGRAVSVALTKNIMLKLSMTTENFELYFGTKKIAEVDQTGLVTVLRPEWNQIYLNFLNEVNHVEA